MFLISAHPR